MTILGITGPTVLLTSAIYKLSKAGDINFIPFFAWSQLWSAVMHWTLASVNACYFDKYITRFSCEIFGLFIAIIYLVTGFEGIIMTFVDGKNASSAANLLQLVISLGIYLFIYIFFNKL